MKRVIIAQRRITHYRVTLFSALKSELAARDIRLEVLVGRGTQAEEDKRDAGDLPWAISVPTRYWLNRRLYWQSLRQHFEAADLGIVTQENKALHNHLLMLAPRHFRLAFWGHGANLQSDNPHGFKEQFKRWMAKQVDWWFAYTEMSADLVRRAGFPNERITVLNNSVDTSELQRERQSVTPQETRVLLERLGFSHGPVGVYVGSLYAAKRLDLLFAAAVAIRREIPDFQLLLVGDGPERDKVQAWCGANPWAHWVGAKFGREKIVCISTAQVMLNPGALGLGVMDAFACQAPMITTDCGRHGPEIAYLEHGKNGVMTPNDLAAYTSGCVQLLRDPVALERLRAGCAMSAREYTLENMVTRFANGIEHALGVEV